MTIRILFFGATADIAGTRDLQIEAAEPKSSSEVFREIVDIYPKLRTHRLLLSLNEKYATGREMLGDGDEIAIFTAVSGG